MPPTLDFLPEPFTHPSLPDLSYYDEYLSTAEEQQLLHAIRSHPNAWKTLRNRSLQNWGGLPHINGMLPTPLPSFLKPLIDSLHTHNIFPDLANHVLINRYFPGQGIDPHLDGPAYKPIAAIVSLSSPILMEFYHKSPDGTVAALAARLLLRPRSLLVMKGKVYHDYFHAISESTHDLIDSTVLNMLDEPLDQAIPRQERVSLTVRASCRTIKNPLLSTKASPLWKRS